jgi:hypothetical protein
MIGILIGTSVFIIKATHNGEMPFDAHAII